MDGFLAWCTCFIDSLGNYKSFGDSKFIPCISASSFEAVLKTSPNWAAMQPLWTWSAGLLYDLSPRLLSLGWGPDKGISTYYSANVTEADATAVQSWADSRGLTQQYNSRVFKLGDGTLQVRLASAQAGTDGADAALLLGRHSHEGRTIEVVRGDYAPLMSRVVAALRTASSAAANAHQREALEGYAESFSTGSQAAHVRGSAAWVKDKGPAVESYLGFIESYRDPLGVRGEWEGFSACVNKVQSAQFGQLVSSAEALLAHMPWPKEYEKDTFLRPDFTSLEVLAFGSSGIPAGINIPNYQETRQSVGFKNVSLGNVLSARNSKERVTFLADGDQGLYSELVGAAFGIQVGLHELLGHGSGKTFQESADGSLNFPAGLPDPLTQQPVATWYKPGQTWDSVFGALASTMEECRAEAVGLFLCVLPEVQTIFGAAHAHGAPHGQQGQGLGPEADVCYVNWLNMARAGLLALQYYNPSTRSWGQAHMQARFALLRVLLEAGVATLHGMGAVSAAAVAEGKVAEGEGGVHVSVDRSSIASKGVPAVGAFLRALNVYKATANAAGGMPSYTKATAVPDEWLPLRELVIANRKPRQMFVQPVLEDAGEAASRDAAGPALPVDARVVQVPGGARLVEFPGTREGLLNAFARRFPEQDPELLALWHAEKDVHAV